MKIIFFIQGDFYLRFYILGAVGKVCPGTKCHVRTNQRKTLSLELAQVNKYLGGFLNVLKSAFS